MPQGQPYREIGAEAIDFRPKPYLGNGLGPLALELVDDKEALQLGAAITPLKQDSLSSFNQSALDQLAGDGRLCVLKIINNTSIQCGTDTHRFKDSDPATNWSLIAFNIILRAAEAGQDGVTHNQIKLGGGIPQDIIHGSIDYLISKGFISKWSADSGQRPKTFYGLPRRTLVFDERVGISEADYYTYERWLNADELLRADTGTEQPPLPWQYEPDQTNAAKRICEYLLGLRDNVTTDELVQNAAELETFINVVEHGMAQWWSHNPAVFRKRAGRLRDIKKQS